MTSSEDKRAPQVIPSGWNGIWWDVASGVSSGEPGRGGGVLTESVVFSGLFVLCVCVCSGRSQGERKRGVSGPHSSGFGDTSSGQSVQMNSPPFPATEKPSKLSKMREGQERGEEVRKALGQQSYLPATQSRTRGSVCTAQLTEPFKPILGPSLGLPTLRGITHPGFVPRARREELKVLAHGRGGSHQQYQSPETSTT